MFKFVMQSEQERIELEIDRPSLCCLDCDDFVTGSAKLFRSTLGINYAKGLEKIPEDRVLVRDTADMMLLKLQGVVQYLDTYRDILVWKYLYEFSAQSGENEGGQSGFKIDGLSAYITTRPTGYCTLHLSEVAPNGMGRAVQVIDMRLKKEIQTDTLGVLKIRRRKFNNMLFPFVEQLTAYLARQGKAEVAVMLAE
ncbi:hypothetical protein [Chitinibacter tainanensis]|uniref:hypothetical protein n=1 Tax=Chitinibacter tainanensis TaxID=230667 RepID=UPI000400442D|nr:hypothetical protein [Chitinibacter tainanensis]